MALLFIILNLLLLQSSIVQARLRPQSKRQHLFTTKPSLSIPMSPHDDFAGKQNNDFLRDSSTESDNQANEQQIEQFARLLIDRLNLREPPNVTQTVDDGAGIPSSIVKQLKQQAEEQEASYRAEEAFKFEQQDRDGSQATTERAILPGHRISRNTCQRQISNKFKINEAVLRHMGCFHFMKSPSDSISLPNDQIVTKLRIYIKKTYFNLNNQHEGMLTPDMFQLYQVFRPQANESSFDSPLGFSDTKRLSISHLKQLSDDWFELTIEQKGEQNNIQQLYQHFMAPWYGLAINREVGKSWSRLYRHYQSKQRFERLLRLNHGENFNKLSDDQLPYMLVEYGSKIVSSLGRRSVRGTVVARPAKPCDPKSPCCRRSLTIDFDQGNNALNFVIYPRKLDIGECVGLCGSSGISLSHTKVKNEQYKNPKMAGYNFVLLNSNGLLQNRSSIMPSINRVEENKNYCCSYSRTGGIELMYRTSDSSPVIRKFIPNIIVEDCRCGSAALI